MDSFKRVSHAVNAILLERWDPIGIREEEGTKDEYRIYVPQLIGRVQRGASDAEVADYLAEVESRDMGLSATPCKQRMEIASRIREAIAQHEAMNLNRSQ